MSTLTSRSAHSALRAARYAPIFAAFAIVAAAIALFRLRTSPFYTHFNGLNSDIYVYQVVGNSWVHGLLPYRDVFDVKGPSFYLLFHLFALIHPWSMAPPLLALTLLAFTSLWLAYAITRQHLHGRYFCALLAVVSCTTIYLAVARVASSFTIEELSVPGVLMLLWIVSRWLGGQDPVPARWWFLDGVVFSSLFWAKYQVIAPWAAMLTVLFVLVIGKQLRARSLGRVVLLNLCGAVLGTMVILSFYIPIIPQVFRAYFAAKHLQPDLSRELWQQLTYIFTTFRTTPQPPCCYWFWRHSR